METINSLFQKDLIFIEDVEKQSEVFNFIGNKLQEENIVNDQFIDALFERENKYPTGLDLSPISEDIPSAAIPHTETEYCKSKCIVFVKLEHPVKFNSMIEPDVEIDVRYLFFIINDQKENQTNVLSELMAFLTNPDNVKTLDSIETKEEIYQFLSEQNI